MGRMLPVLLLAACVAGADTEGQQSAAGLSAGAPAHAPTATPSVTICSVSLTSPDTYVHDFAVGEACMYKRVGTHDVFGAYEALTLGHSLGVEVDPTLPAGTVATFVGDQRVDSSVRVHFGKNTLDTRCDLWTGTATVVSQRPSFHVSLNLTCANTWGFPPVGSLHLVGDMSSTL
jgi:hypothetical protein